MRTRTLTLAASLLLFSLTAHADTKSWTAVKGKLPAGANVVVSIDVSQIAKTQAYGTVVQAFLDEEQDAKQAFELIKTTCGIDVTTAVSDVTVLAINDDKDDRALIAIGLNGIDQAKASTCLQSLTEMDAKGAKVTAKTKGKVTEYSVAGKDEKLYVAWLTKDVVAVASDPFTKGKLDKMLAGKAAKGDLKTFMGKTTSTSAMFFAVTKKEKVPDVGTTKGGYGTIDIAAGTVSFKASLVMSSADAATKMAAATNAQLQEVAKKAGAKSPDLAKVIGDTKIGAAGAEVTVSGSVTEKLIQSLIPQLDKIL